VKALAACCVAFVNACRSNPQEPERPRFPAEQPVVEDRPPAKPPVYRHGESIRVGVAGGYLVSSASVELESPITRDPELEDDHGWSGFVEIIAEGTVHLRCTGARTDHDLLRTQTSARVRQGALLAMVPFENAISEHITLTPLFGLGVGYTEVTLDPPLGVSDLNGASLLFAAACEAEIAGHVFLGAMLTAGLFGDPGDTEGTTGSVLVYAGVRL
jgi:hypothetical protein